MFAIIRSVRTARTVAMLLACGAAALHAQTVELFSPQGEVKGVRQVTARFAQAMVPFGDPRSLDPFAIDCAEKGTGRWADPKNWVFDFARDLPAGVRCTFTVKAGLADVAGTAVPGGQKFEFTTGGPAIVRSLPYEGSRIDENQVFVLGLDAPVKPETIVAHAHCVAAGINEEIPVRLVTGTERKTILDNRKSFAASYLRVIFLDGGEGRSRGFLFRLPVTGSDQDKFLRLRDAPESPLVTIACARPLPANAEMKLVWGKGIAATTGVATSEAQSIAYQVRPAFRASFTCERVNKDAQCIPILPLALSFTAPIAKADAEKIRLVDAAGTVYPPKLPKDEGNGIEGVTFGPGLPEKQQFRIELPDGLKDDAGRPLANAKSFPLRVRTDENPPLVKFAANFGILERVLPGDEKPMLPVTVRNVEPVLPGQVATVRDAAKAAAAKDAPIPGQVMQVKRGDEMQIVDWLRRLFAADRIDREYDDKSDKWTVRRNGFAESIFKAADVRTKISVPKPGGAKAFEVVGIPLPNAGFYVVELASPRLGAALLGQPKPFYVRAATLVTNLGVHFKLGRESSLVWVTRLDDAAPVANAAVAVRDCGGRVYFEGRTDASGIARIAKALPVRDALPFCNVADAGKEFFVTARTDDDMAFAFSSWGEGIAPWRFNVPTANWSGPYLAHAVLDRSLVRAGETVSMKVFVRQQTSAGFALPPRKGLEETLTIRHMGSDREYDIPVKWSGTPNVAAGEATFEVPKDAYAGTYQINVNDTLGGHSKDAQERVAGTFRVEAFRVPLLRARLQAVGMPLVNPPDVNVDVQVSYLAGGGAGGLSTTLRSQVDDKVVTFPDYDDWTFAGGDVKVGREEQGDATARFDDYEFADPDMETDGDASRPSRAKRGTDLPLTLDAAGGARATIRNVGTSDTPRELVAELEYRDPNGETLTAATRVTLWPAKIVLGIKPDSWVASKERLKFTVIALNLAGKPVPGVAVHTDAFKRDYFSHRRRLIGGFYAYEHGYETTRAGALCNGVTDKLGLLVCEMPPPGTGNLILRAQAADADGRPVVTRADAWVAAEDDQWFAASDNDRIDLLPEKKSYDPGQSARFQVRSPFKDATVLVTIEREGVLDAFVQKLSRADPVLDVPMKGSYAPNVFVSAFLVRGRIADAAPTALIDLGKPSFKMGLAEVKVGWSAHALAVQVTPGKPVYKVRDKATATIAVRRPDGSAPPKGSEVALAAVDEGLLELLPNNSWKLLDAMMARRGDEVETATAQMQVIGKRHFGRKAIAPGGGGGRASSRELFDTLLLWKARVPLDDDGNATVEIPLNDSLTSFRIVAVASSGPGLFGTGEASIRSTQDLMLLSGLPTIVRDGDRFRATFTVRNASQRPLAVDVTAAPSATGAILAPLAPQAVTLKAGEARELYWEIAVPATATSITWQVDAVAKDEPPGDGAHDSLKVAQKVVPAVPERTYQATILQLKEPQAIAVQRPADAIPGRGGINVQLQAKLAGDLPGVRDFFLQYPYSCFEQKTSIAIGLGDKARWAGLMATLPDYLDRDGLVKYWTLMRDGDDTLTAYVLSIAAEAGYAIPDRERNRMEQALIGFVEGRVVRYSAMPTADLAIRKVAALEALSRRAEPLNAKWLDSIAIEPNLWPTSAVIDWYLVLKRQPKLPRHDERIKAAEQILRSRLNFQGTTMGFSTEKTDALWWLMVSADSNATRLLLAFNDVPAWKDDMPRLVRGALGRMQHGRWNTTVANAWGRVALAKFSARFETTPVTGTTVAQLGDASFAHPWRPDDETRPYARKLPWPEGRGEVTLKQQDGTGAPWVTLQSLAAIPLTAPLSSGYRITRTVTPVQQQTKDAWKRGDVARVRLEVEAQSDMAWVVVDDPLPAGSTALGRGLGGDSTLATQGEQKVGTVWPAFEERTLTAYRAYFRYVPKGRFVTEYTVRLNNPGTFNLPATRVEAMYAPEMFGEVPIPAWSVQP